MPKLASAVAVVFRIEAAITRRPPHRSVREDFHSYGSSVSSRTRISVSETRTSRVDTPWRLPMLPLYTLIDASVTPVHIRAQVPLVCHINERKTWRHHPYSGSLGSHFPTFSGRDVCLDPSVLCSAKTTQSPSRFFQLSLFPRYLAHSLCFVFLLRLVGTRK